MFQWLYLKDVNRNEHKHTTQTTRNYDYIIFDTSMILPFYSVIEEDRKKHLKNYLHTVTD